MHEFINQINFNFSALETLAVFFSLLYVFLASKNHIYCWVAGGISVLFYIYICYHAGLFAETMLQFFYLIMSIYGYLNWNKNNGDLPIIQWSIKTHWILIFTCTIIAFFTGFLLKIYTSAEMPLIDSFTTVFSITTTYMVAKKVLGNWIYWIIIDLVSIYLYSSRELYLTSFLFIAYTFLAIYGYSKWLTTFKKDV